MLTNNQFVYFTGLEVSKEDSYMSERLLVAWIHLSSRDIACLVHVYVMRKLWIGTIHGLRCSKYGSVLCAGNPWIAQHLRDPWIAQPH